MELLAGKTVLITGAAGGQGRAHALASAAEGANVVLVDQQAPNSPAYGSILGQVEALGGRGIALSADVCSQQSIDSAAARALAEFGSVDAAVINAGVYRPGLFWETSEEDWRHVMDVNLDGAWRTAKAVASTMVEQRSGSIVVISSVDGIDPETGSTAYGVSKGALLTLMKYMAKELAPHGVRVNAIAPGLIDTAMVNSQEYYDFLAGGKGKGTRQDLLDLGLSYTALRGVSVLDPEEVAKTAVYLNSALAQKITGVTIPVDAGHLLNERVNQDPARFSQLNELSETADRWGLQKRNPMNS